MKLQELLHHLVDRVFPSEWDRTEAHAAVDQHFEPAKPAKADKEPGRD